MPSDEQLEIAKGKHVRIWRDDDNPGDMHTKILVAAYQQAGALSVTVVDLASHPANTKPGTGFDSGRNTAPRYDIAPTHEKDWNGQKIDDQKFVRCSRRR